MIRQIAKTAACGILAGASFAGIGRWIDSESPVGIGNPQSVVDGYTIYDLTTASEALDDTTELYKKELEAQQVRRQKLGEGCAVFLDRYIRDDEVFGYSGGSEDEEVVLEDALSDPSSPCGNSRSDIRFAFRAQISDAETVAAAGGKKEKAADAVEDFQERIADDVDFSGAKTLGAIGAVIGLVAGYVVSDTPTKRRRY